MALYEQPWFQGLTPEQKLKLAHQEAMLAAQERPIEPGWLGEQTLGDVYGVGKTAAYGLNKGIADIMSTAGNVAEYADPLSGKLQSKFRELTGMPEPQADSLEAKLHGLTKKLSLAGNINPALQSALQPAMNPPQTEFQKKYSKPIWETSGGTPIIPSLGQVAFDTGNFAPEIAASMYGPAVTLGESVGSRVMAKYGPQVAKSLSTATKGSTGGLIGGLAKGDPQSAAMNAVAFPLASLGGEGLMSYAKPVAEAIKGKIPFLRNNTVTPPAPESPETLMLQMQSLARGDSKAVLVTPGAEAPIIPDGMKTLETKVGSWVYNPNEVKPYEINKAVAKNEYGELLGHVEPKSPATSQAVAAIQDGIEAKTSLASPENVPAQAEALQSQFPDANIQVGGPGLANDIVAARQPAMPPSAGAVPPPAAPQARGFTDTVRNSPMSPEALGKGVSGTYDPINNPATMQTAQRLVNENPTAARDLVLSDKEPTAESYSMAMELIRQNNAKGDFGESIRIANHMASQATKQGQAIQALSMYSKLGPDGILRFAAKAVQDARDLVPKGRLAQLDAATQKIAKGVQVQPAEVVPQLVAEFNPQQDVLSKLFSELEEAFSPKKVSIRELVESEAGKLRIGSSDISKIASGIKDAKMSISELVKEHYAGGNPSKAELTKKLVELGGIEPSQASKLSTAIANRFKDLAKEKKVEVSTKMAPLDRAIREPRPRSPLAGDAPEQRLASRVDGAMTSREPAATDPIKDMVDTLYSVAKESLPKTKAVPKNPISLIGDAVRNAEEYKGVWGKAQQLVGEKFKDNPEALQILDQFIKDPLATPFAKRQLVSSMRTEMKAQNVNLGEIIKKHYSAVNASQEALAQKLVQQAGLSGEQAVTLSAEVQQRFGELIAEKKGQALKSMFKTKIGTKQRLIDQKIIEMSNMGAFDNEMFRELAAEKLGIPNLSKEFAQDITQRAAALQTMPEGREKAMATAELLRDIAELAPASLARKVSGFQTIAQLANPKTLIRNIAGNMAFAVGENAKDVVAAPLDMALSLVTGKRTKSLSGLNQIGAQAKGFMSGLKEGAGEAWRGVDLTNIADKWEINQLTNKLPLGRTFRGKIMGNIERTLGVALKAPDRAFYKAAVEKSLAEQAKLAGLKAPTAEMLANAHFEGLYKTFQDDSVAARMFSGIKKSLNVGKEFGLGDILLKYPKTPGNLIARSMDYSPAGIVKGLMEVGKAATGRGFDQKAFVDSTSRAIFGTGGLTGLGYILSDLGLLKQSSPKDPKMRGFEQEEGLNQSQLNVDGIKRYIMSGFDKKEAQMREGDSLVTYDWAVPLSVPVAMGARAQEEGVSMSSAPSYLGIASSALESGINTLGEQPLIKTLTKLGKGDSLAESLIETGKGIPGSFTPTALKQANQLFDNKVRDTYDKDPAKMALNLVLNKTPYASSLPEKVGALGETKEMYQGGTNSSMNVLFNPAFVSKYKPTPETTFLKKLYANTDDKSALPYIVPAKFKLSGIPIEMNAKQKNFVQRWVGSKTKAFISSLATNPKIDSIPDDLKVELVSNKIRDLKTMAQTGIFLDLVEQNRGQQSDDDHMKQLFKEYKLSPDQMVKILENVAIFKSTKGEGL